MLEDSRQTGLDRLRGLRAATAEAGGELADQRHRFARLRGDDAAPRVVSSFNLFQTPEPLADRLAELAELDRLGDGARLLEPSAGLGRLYRAARRTSGELPVVLVEVSHECCGELYRTINGDDWSKLVQADFLSCTAARLGGLFDRIVMNPPFKLGADVKHIEHARELLAPGGRLVALCANGPRQRAKLQPTASEWHELPANSFQSEGTRVDAAIYIFNRGE